MTTTDSENAEMLHTPNSKEKDVRGVGDAASGLTGNIIAQVIFLLVFVQLCMAYKKSFSIREHIPKWITKSVDIQPVKGKLLTNVFRRHVVTLSALRKCLSSFSLSSKLKQNLGEQTFLTWFVPAIRDIITYNVHDSILPVLNRICIGEHVSPNESMRYETLRFSTFSTYPPNKPYSIRLAQAGFYYFGTNDEVACYCCGVRVSNWKEDDSPIDIHEIVSPRCEFIVNNGNVNVLVTTEPRDLLGKTESNSLCAGKNRPDSVVCSQGHLSVSGANSDESLAHPHLNNVVAVVHASPLSAAINSVPQPTRGDTSNVATQPDLIRKATLNRVIVYKQSQLHHFTSTSPAKHKGICICILWSCPGVIGRSIGRSVCECLCLKLSPQ